MGKNAHSHARLFYFKKYAFKKHKAQNTKKLRNMCKKHSQAEIQDIQESAEKNFNKPNNL